MARYDPQLFKPTPYFPKSCLRVHPAIDAGAVEGMAAWPCHRWLQFFRSLKRDRQLNTVWVWHPDLACFSVLGRPVSQGYPKENLSSQYMTSRVAYARSPFTASIQDMVWIFQRRHLLHHDYLMKRTYQIRAKQHVARHGSGSGDRHVG